ncbi:MAG TPA: sarcosine oxidase subunit gamma family protein [Pseudonocardia sp.]|nr:sarcosine oxidase subunit gamma family protein [Pseudonocardia sp.]
MTVEATRRSPLSGWRLNAPELEVQAAEVPFLTSVNLRVGPGPAQPFEPGLSLPTTPNAVVSRDDLAVLWLGPDEFLVVGHDGAGPELMTRLRVRTGGRWASAVDVSADRACVELRGAGVREVLEKGCPLDLHRRAFPPGRCAQTVLAKAQVILWRPAEQVYRLLVRRSYAHYLAAWLSDSANP